MSLALRLVFCGLLLLGTTPGTSLLRALVPPMLQANPVGSEETSERMEEEAAVVRRAAAAPAATPLANRVPVALPPRLISVPEPPVRQVGHALSNGLRAPSLT